MGFLELINYIVVLSVVIHLFFELFNSWLKLLLHIHDFKFKITNFLLVVPLYLRFFLLHFHFIFFKLFLTFLLFLGVFILQLFNFLFQAVLLFCFIKSFLLLSNNWIGIFQNSIDLLFISVNQGLVVELVLFILGVEVENDFG